MLYYGRTDLTDLTDLIETVAKSNDNKEWIACHYWYFNHGFKF